MSDLPAAPLRPDESHLTEWQRFRRICEREVYWQFDKAEYYSFNKLFAILEHLFDPQSPADLTADNIAVLDGYIRNQMGLSEATSYNYHVRLSRFLKFAECRGLIPKCPLIRIKSFKPKMRGRPVTKQEFDRMIEYARTQLQPRYGKACLFRLRGLWHSGLRLRECVRLTWHPSPFCVDLSGKKPMFRVASGGDKSTTFKRFPIAPGFAKMLLAIPESNRVGYVFGTASKPLHFETLWRTVISIAQATDCVTVTEKGERKPITPHDFRRSFARRWAKRLPPDRLMLIMRHASYQTTIAHYLDTKSEDAAADMWRYFRKRKKVAIPRNENFVIVRDEVAVDRTAWPYVAFVPPGLESL